MEKEKKSLLESNFKAEMVLKAPFCHQSNTSLENRSMAKVAMIFVNAYTATDDRLNQTFIVSKF